MSTAPIFCEIGGLLADPSAFSSLWGQGGRVRAGFVWHVVLGWIRGWVVQVVGLSWKLRGLCPLSRLGHV